MVFILNPVFGLIDAVTLPLAILDKSKPTILLADISVNPLPFPKNEPLNEPLLNDPLNKLKLADKDDILALLVVILDDNDEEIPVRFSPFIVNEPVTETEPVNWWLSESKDPNLVEPVMNSVEDVIT